MIVLEDKRLAIITPPHTASGNVHRVLCARPHAYWIVGPTPTGATVDHHYPRVANGWADYHVALVWRPPLDRLVGLYEHHAWWQEHRGLDPLAWPAFATAVAADDEELGWFYRWTIARLLGEQHIDRLIDFRHLESDLSELLGERITLPPPHTTHAPPAAYHERLDHVLRNDLDRWAEPDDELRGRLV